MQNTFSGLIRQTFDWPSMGFSQHDDHLNFHNIPLMELIEAYGTPFRITYLPKISEQIEKSRRLFQESIERNQYKGGYVYTYCTKSSHFRFVLNEVLKNDVHLETSSGYDLDLIQQLLEEKWVDQRTIILCNGFKLPSYTSRIAHMTNRGFNHLLPILDNMEELEAYKAQMEGPFDVGLRIAAEEEPNFEFYTSRLGIRYNDIQPFYRQQIKNDERVNLKMVHFFINTGIRDTVYYWSELNKCLEMYCQLKQECPELGALDLGGGLPVPQSLYFDYDYGYMIDEIVKAVKQKCDAYRVPHPDLYTEFGAYTVAESGAIIYAVAGVKHQNDAETWYMIDSSILNTVPDAQGIRQRYITLPINHWDQPYHRVSLGGLTCDSADYYNASIHQYQVYMPVPPRGQPLYVGFFHSGAYQEALGGYGGIQHCLIPAPKHILAYHDARGKLVHQLFAPEQASSQMMHHLGYGGFHV